MNTSAREPIGWCSGRVGPLSDLTIPITDRGFSIGDGVYETIGVVHGRPFELDRHLRRLGNACDAIGLDIPPELHRAIDAVTEANWGANAARAGGRLRIQITGGTVPVGVESRGAWRGGSPTLVVLGEPGAIPNSDGPGAISVTTGPYERNARSSTAGIKSSSYAENLLAFRWAVARGFDEYIFCCADGRLSEGTRSNVLVSLNGRFVTPTLESGCLPGIGRELMIEAGIVEEVDVHLDRPDQALAPSEVTEMICISAAGGVRFARLMNSHSIAEEPGPLAMAAWTEIERRRALHRQ